MKVSQATLAEPKTGKEFFVNGIRVATYEKTRELYSSRRPNGAPSHLRSISKVTHHFQWDSEGLRSLLGNEKAITFRRSHRVEGPDHNWGFTGAFFTLKDLREFFRSL